MQRTIRFASIIVGLAVLGILGAAAVEAQTIGQLPNDGLDHVGQTIVITDVAQTFSEHCGTALLDYPCLVIDPAGGDFLQHHVLTR